jgi:hypothetical protein
MWIGQQSRSLIMKSLDQTLLKAKAKAKRVLAVTQLFGIALVATLSYFNGVAFAQPTEGGGHRVPPAEALAACKSLASGAECGFTSERGTMKGNCWAPEGKPLACKPKGAPMPDEQPAPPRK